MLKKKVKKSLRNSDSTRSSILKAAIEVFVKKGFGRASLEEIASEANVTRGAVYWHFKNKQDIFEALHEALYQPVTASIMEDMQENCDDSLQQLENLCVKLLINLDNDKMRKKILKVFYCKCDYSCEMEVFLEKQKKQKLKNIDLFTKYFDKAKKNNYLSKDIDPKIAAVSLACYMSGIVIEYLRNPKLFNLKTQAAMLIGQFFKIYKKQHD